MPNPVPANLSQAPTGVLIRLSEPGTQDASSPSQAPKQETLPDLKKQQVMALFITNNYQGGRKCQKK